MAWSTRELAEIAGTTVNTVRHYHRLGILGEPERAANGYKQYETSHLVRLLHIRHLRELGVPTSRIERHDSETENSELLPEIDANLAASIARLLRARAEIQVILAGASTARESDGPAANVAVADVAGEEPNS